MTRARLVAVGALLLAAAGASGAQEAGPETDPATGLVIAPGWQRVRTECTECHSTRLILQTRGTREHWLGLIRWMQETQKLRRLDPALQDEILDYLAAAYGLETRPRRRAPLPPLLLPPGPRVR